MFGSGVSAGTFAEARRQRRVFQDGTQGVGDGRRALFALDQRAGFGRGAHVAAPRGDRGKSGRHGFQQGERHALRFGSVDERGRRRERGRLGGFIQEAQPAKPVAAAEVRRERQEARMVGRVLGDVAGDGQDEVRKIDPQHREGDDNVFQPLLRHDATDEEQHVGGRFDAMRGTERPHGVGGSTRHRRDAVGDDMDVPADAEFGQLLGLERREGEDAGGGVQVRPADEAMVEPLLQRLERPAGEEDRIQRPMRMEEVTQALATRDHGDIVIQRMEGAVRVQDDVFRQFREGIGQRERPHIAQRIVGTEVTDRQAAVDLLLPCPARVDGPDLDIGARPALRRGQLEHHLLHPSGISTGEAFIDDVTDGGHERKRVSNMEYRV